MKKDHKLTRGEGDALDCQRIECQSKNRMTAVNPLSTKNATELPKCSKTLHFCRLRVAERERPDGE
jgi:hypothetical protein